MREEYTSESVVDVDERRSENGQANGQDDRTKKCSKRRRAMDGASCTEVIRGAVKTIESV